MKYNYNKSIANRNNYIVRIYYRMPYEDKRTQYAKVLVYLKDNELGAMKEEFIEENLQNIAYQKLCSARGCKLGSIIVTSYSILELGDDLFIL